MTSSQKFIAELMKELCKGIGVKVSAERVVFYCEHLDDLTETQLRYGFENASRNLGEFLPSVQHLREWCESFRPAPQAPASISEPQDCELCAGEGRLYVTWVFGREMENGALVEIRQPMQLVPYSQASGIKLGPQEYPSLYRCSCVAADKHPKRWPRFPRKDWNL